MKAKTLVSTAAATTIMAAAMMTVSSPAVAASSERCADIVKAGKNACEANGHSCAGQSKVDNQKDEWIKVPTGTCGNIVAICAGTASAPEGVDEKKMARVCKKVADQTDASIVGGRVVQKGDT